MKRRKIREKPKQKYFPHRAKHHGKLFILVVSKIFVAFVAFLIGLFFGSQFADPPYVIFIAFFIAILIYLLYVLHIIDALKI